MSGIRFTQGWGIIDRKAKEQGCGRTMEELQLQQRQMSGKGSPEGLVYWCLAKRTFWTTIISSGPLTFRWSVFPPSSERAPSIQKRMQLSLPSRWRWLRAIPTKGAGWTARLAAMPGVTGWPGPLLVGIPPPEGASLGWWSGQPPSPRPRCWWCDPTVAWCCSHQCPMSGHRCPAACPQSRSYVAPRCHRACSTRPGPRGHYGRNSMPMTPLSTPPWPRRSVSSEPGHSRFRCYPQEL
jgi:hypothetical protein